MKTLITLIKILCVASFCRAQCGDLLSDLSQDDCIAQQNDIVSYYYWVNDKCIPSCQEYSPEGYFARDCPCAPGYTCAKRCSGSIENYDTPCETDDICIEKFARSYCVEVCVTDDTTCMAYHANTSDYRNKKFSAEIFKPACRNDGLWKAKQCKGGLGGRCMCYDPNGVRLFGEAKHSQAKDMTCECSARKAELLKSGVRDYVSLHCDSMGNFEPLQCDSGLCWCADGPTGEPVSLLVPEKAMVLLPCYEASKVGSQYLRQCDSVTYANAGIERHLRQHGVVNVNMGVKTCDGDGAYGNYNVSQGIACCTWRDGTKIGSWQSDAGTDIGSLNCNCARDFKRYSHGLTCLSNGNYQAYQSYIKDMKNYYYCVDDDGFQKTKITEERLDNCTLYY